MISATFVISLLLAGLKLVVTRCDVPEEGKAERRDQDVESDRGGRDGRAEGGVFRAVEPT